MSYFFQAIYNITNKQTYLLNNNILLFEQLKVSIRLYNIFNYIYVPIPILLLLYVQLKKWTVGIKLKTV